MSLLLSLREFVFPRACPVCGCRLSLSEEHLCLECLVNLPRTMLQESPSRNTMKDLFELQIPVIRAAAYMRYMPGSYSAGVVKSIKYGGGVELARYMGGMMAEEFQGFFAGVDLILPMPLTKGRRRRRGYNQSEEIAAGISKVTGIRVENKVVIRRSFVVSQTLLTRYERHGNVEGAFVCVRPELLSGKHVLLVDDVVTTGATVLSLARAIMSATEGCVFSVLSLAVTGEIQHFQ